MVAWDNVTRDAVMRAITGYDRLGPAVFFSVHGFGPAVPVGGWPRATSKAAGPGP
jgi:hypothetical protein